MPEKHEDIARMYEETFHDVKQGSIVKGKIVQLAEHHALIDIGYKSEGAVAIREFSEPVKVGDEVDVAIEQLEDENGTVVLSKERAAELKNWENLKAKYKNGEIIEGKITRRIKGGYLVNIGVDAFLPASQIYPQPQGTTSQPIAFKIIKITEEKKNIVLSQRAASETEKNRSRAEILSSLEKGQMRKGKVKNITDFGAFVDLGGVDGLLHVTDISWGRISHPSETLAIGDDLEVVVLNFDKAKGKISLGLKQKTPSPWTEVSDKYPVESKHTGRVVNITDYGAFIELEKGVEGLVHISEMSWTKRLSHPSELVAIGDMVEVITLNIDSEKQKIALGMKQVEPNPWTFVKEKYPAGSTVKGKIRNITDYGAFLELEKGIDGLIHISDMSWSSTKHPSEILKKGDKVEAVVLEIAPDNKKISLGLKQLQEDPWQKVTEKYKAGDIVKGKVTKIVPFGAFVELEEGIEGLLHTSQIGEKQLSEGDILEVQLANVESERRKIALDILIK